MPEPAKVEFRASGGQIPSRGGLVSIILPTYNRVSFLSEALAAIQAQTFANWELIVVDDGSTDYTPAVLERLVADLGQTVQIVRQSNQGAYGARNSGLDQARGKYIAFYDSDDVWLPHHLADCVGALEAHAEIDWVFGACRRVEHASNRVLLENTFYNSNGSPWPFLELKAQVAGRLRMLDDSRTLSCMLGAGLNCGLQASVIRREFFDHYRFPTQYRNEAEDQMAVIWALTHGHRMAYFDAVHVVYRVHGENSSATGPQALDKRLFVLESEARGYEELAANRRGVRLAGVERRVLRHRLCQLYFWQIGYVLHWQNGRRDEALAMFRRGIRFWPWSPACWKTYCLAICRQPPSPAFEQLAQRMEPQS